MKHPVSSAFVAILFLLAISPAHAAINVSSTVGDSILVSYSLENLDPTIYGQIKSNQGFNSSTIPLNIVQNLEKQNLMLVRWGPGPQTEVAYDDATNSIKTSFYLGGSDIVRFTLNGTTMRRAYEVKTNWRKFTISFTANFTIDFASRLAKPLEEWQKTNPTTFSYENSEPGAIDVSFSLTLPGSASKIQAQVDTVTYEMPPRPEDQLINSPFLIIGAMAVALAVVLIYRRVR